MVAAQLWGLILWLGLWTPSSLVLLHGTVVDVRDFGHSTVDLRDAAVVIENGKIATVGVADQIRIPPGARVLDVSGKYIVPGLIDGFAGLNSQGQASAYLYMGVTSIVGVEDERRGRLCMQASPRPRILRLAAVGYEAKTEADVKRLAQEGVRVLLLHYPLTPQWTRQAVGWARENHLATIGELGYTSYREAIEAGVNAFVHTTRYSMDLAPAEVRRGVAADPFGRPRDDYYEMLPQLSRNQAAVSEHARRLAASHVGLIPTLSLEYLDLPGHANLWREPAAVFLDAAAIHLPADPLSGERKSGDGFPPALAQTVLQLESRYCQAGSKYLAGSGTCAFGTMPGISLHTELELLVRVGLSPRQALAAATANYAELYGWADIGQIRSGANADLVVVDADPTIDIHNLKRIHAVVLNGQLMDRTIEEPQNRR